MNDGAIAVAISDAVADAGVLRGTEMSAYRIGAAAPAAVVRPGSAEAVAQLLALANEHGWAVSPRGGGTALDLGNPLRRLDVVLDLGRMSTVVDYQPDDLTVTAQAGVTIGQLNRVLAARNQELPLDVPLPNSATVGGALATNLSGPRRMRYGTARDLAIGMQAATPASGLHRAGGKVVKNVAGYDLVKLQIGALGTTAVITEVTFKLLPVPRACAAIAASFASCEQAHNAAMGLMKSPLFPAALEMLGPTTAGRLLSRRPDNPESGWQLVVLLLGAPSEVQRQVKESAAWCRREDAANVSELSRQESDDLFERIRDYGRSVRDPAAMIVRAGVLPLETAWAAGLLRGVAQIVGSAPELICRPASGNVMAYWRQPDPANVERAVATARAELARKGGSLIAERVAAEVAPRVDAWGIDGPDVELMRRLKQAYDPAAILNPGRFVAGF